MPLVLALDLLQATALVGAVLGAAGVLGLTLGLALRDIVENYLSSILLSLRRPFDPHDLVRIGDQEGRVMRLTTPSLSGASRKPVRSSEGGT